MPLDRQTQLQMAGAAGAEFSQVRVHAGPHAAAAARSVGAAAFTLGPDIVFGVGRYAPETARGRRLLAHELTHVVEQGFGGLRALIAPRIQLSPDGPDAAVGQGLPWQHGNTELFELKSGAIRFFVASTSDQQKKAAQANAKAIAGQISAANARIADPARRVAICFIVSTTTRFADWQGTPVLMLDHDDATAATATHEMGHAIFDALGRRAVSKAKGAAGAMNLRLRIADIYARLMATTHAPESTKSFGILIADPPTWGSETESEHPWADPDEFFASARKAFVLNPKGFKAAIKRATAIDKNVGPPAQELLSLLGEFAAGRLPSKGVPKGRLEDAQEAMLRATGVSQIESTVMPNTPLDWLLHPDHRPQRAEARPSIESP